MVTWPFAQDLTRQKSRACCSYKVIWDLGVPSELTGCWQNLVPCIAGLRATFSCWLPAGSCSQPLKSPCHPLPRGPLHNTAVSFFKASRKISLFIWLRASFMYSRQKSDNPIILAGDGHLGGHLRLLPATVVNGVRREERWRTRWQDTDSEGPSVPAMKLELYPSHWWRPLPLGRYRKMLQAAGLMIMSCRKQSTPREDHRMNEGDKCISTVQSSHALESLVYDLSPHLLTRQLWESKTTPCPVAITIRCALHIPDRKNVHILHH